MLRSSAATHSLVPDGVLVCVGSAVAVEDAVGVGVAVAEREIEGDLLAVPPVDSVVVGVAVTVLERLADVDPLSLLVAVPVGVPVAVPVPDRVLLLVGVMDGVLEGVAVAERVDVLVVEAD